MLQEELENAANKLMKEVVRFRSLHIKGKPTPGIKPSEMFLLMHLAHWQDEQNGLGAKISELSERLNVKAPTITQSVNNLEQLGIVQRTPDKEDRRLVRVCLTDRGRELAFRNKKQFESEICRLVEYLGPQKSLTLAQLIDEVYEFMNTRRQGTDDLQNRL